IRMCSGDTIGPGGVFRALREFDEIRRIVEEVERLCPEAWLVNYINPSAVFGMALQKNLSYSSFCFVRQFAYTLLATELPGAAWV
ncbi:MAG: hypothetical protein LR015_10390, partial [Verrucomicrobia bacterium]|nr:hypothetical protein [Verrucomicrobiota bacterium]